MSESGVLGEPKSAQMGMARTGHVCLFQHICLSLTSGMTNMRGVLLSWLCLIQVDMTWSGHVHLYERTCPILFHECLGYSPDGIPNAPVHMSIGNGGVSAPR